MGSESAGLHGIGRSFVCQRTHPLTRLGERFCVSAHPHELVHSEKGGNRASALPPPTSGKAVNRLAGTMRRKARRPTGAFTFRDAPDDDRH